MKSCFFAFFNLNAFLIIIYSGTSEQEIADLDKNYLELYRNISSIELIELIELYQNTITVIKEIYFESYINYKNTFEDKDMLYAPDENISKSENYYTLSNNLLRFYISKKAHMLIKYPHTSSFLSNFKYIVNNFNTNLDIDFLKNILQIDSFNDEIIINHFLSNYFNYLDWIFDISFKIKLDEYFIVSDKKEMLNKKNDNQVYKDTDKHFEEKLSMEEYNKKEFEKWINQTAIFSGNENSDIFNKESNKS